MVTYYFMKQTFISCSRTLIMYIADSLWNPSRSVGVWGYKKKPLPKNLSEAVSIEWNELIRPFLSFSSDPSFGSRFFACRRWKHQGI